VITNVFTATVTLDSIQVRGDGKLLLALAGKGLVAHTFALFGETPTVTIPTSSTVKTLVE
jgi:hypothetical protein